MAFAVCGSGGRPDRQDPKTAVGTTAATPTVLRAGFTRKSLDHTPPAWVESGALFSEESCSFSQRDLQESLNAWLSKATAQLQKTNA